LALSVGLIDRSIVVVAARQTPLHLRARRLMQ
jgi:hypothetical protein